MFLQMQKKFLKPLWVNNCIMWEWRVTLLGVGRHFKYLKGYGNSLVCCIVNHFWTGFALSTVSSHTAYENKFILPFHIHIVTIHSRNNGMPLEGSPSSYFCDHLYQHGGNNNSAIHSCT